MTDIWPAQKRSEVMGQIRSRGNKSTELRLMAIFKSAGITGWRRSQRLAGNPDFVFRSQRLRVFVDGCFWHGCPRHGTRPRQNRAFWDAKLARNRARDRQVGRELRKAGWRVLRVWEHALAARAERMLVARLRRMLADC